MSELPALNDDFRDMLVCLLEAGAEFMIVGAHALSVHGYPRATGDIDIFVRPSPENARRVVAALDAFGAPRSAHGIRAEDFEVPETVYQIGLPPRRIDILTAISGVDFLDAQRSHVTVEVDGLRLCVIGREALIRNKRAAARPKDLLDAEELERASLD